MGKSISKAFKSITRAVKRTAKSFVTSGIDGVSSLLKGDLGGVADAATRAVTYGTVSLSDKGLIKTNMIGEPKQTTDSSVPVTNQAEAADGLLNYVADLRSRKSRRNRESTNNTGSSSVDGNKLSGTTALGV